MFAPSTETHQCSVSKTVGPDPPGGGGHGKCLCIPFKIIKKKRIAKNGDVAILARPLLKKIFPKIFSTPVPSSAFVEHFFSIGGNALDKKKKK